MTVKDIARVYASSLVELGQEKNILSEIEEEIKFISDFISENSDLRQLLYSPCISKDSKKELLEKAFSGGLSNYTLNFLGVLIENDRISKICDIYSDMIELLDEVNNRKRVTVITSEGLDSSLVEGIVNILEEKLEEDVIVKEEIDEDILGGIIIKIDDLIIDGSLVKNINSIRTKLLNSKVRSEMAYED